MKISTHIDAIGYEWVEADDSLNVAHKQLKQFNNRHEIEQFITKALETDSHTLSNIVSDPLINTTDKAAVFEHLAERIESKALLVQLAPGSSSAPNAPRRAAIPGSDPREGISSIYSGQMRQFLAENRLESSQAAAMDTSNVLRGTSSPSSPTNTGNTSASNTNNMGAGYTDDTPQNTDTSTTTQHKIVVEIIGKPPRSSQSLEISTPNKHNQQERETPHPQERHRSLVTFTGLPNTSHQLNLLIATNGYGNDLILPLQSGFTPVDKNTNKPLWDTVIAAIRPAIYYTKPHTPQAAHLAHEGFLYVIWKQKVWRELVPDGRGSYRDVDVGYYRQFPAEPAKRKTRGKALPCIWLPYRINGEPQTGNQGIFLLYSRQPLEYNAAERLLNNATALDELSSYTSQKTIAPGTTLQPIKSAIPTTNNKWHEQYIQTKHHKLLSYVRKEQTPVAHLAPINRQMTILIHDLYASHFESRNKIDDDARISLSGSGTEQMFTLNKRELTGYIPLDSQKFQLTFTDKLSQLSDQPEEPAATQTTDNPDKETLDS